MIFLIDPRPDRSYGPRPPWRAATLDNLTRGFDSSTKPPFKSDCSGLFFGPSCARDRPRRSALRLDEPMTVGFIGSGDPRCVQECGDPGLRKAQRRRHQRLLRVSDCRRHSAHVAMTRRRDRPIDGSVCRARQPRGAGIQTRGFSLQALPRSEADSRPSSKPEFPRSLFWSAASV